ncbi:hypothetical protein CAPTEDRAFT_224147 [Capitella teleta]|uniref:Globin domain-containing protein n=1 Tax=Capitella teleta TaxID=283909 RepID=R7TJV2_CAPTE|nr:hypothetical protein CAPTEDRAFT_224147 [Capitella teleta]|eukprot:ELT91375.1 hypothetical protein CAPTEDRAFT_224147 [Capitella teleta]
MSELTKESCRFVENATQVISTLGKCIANFHDALLLPTCFEEFHRCHCPYYKDKHASLQYHHKLFLETFYNTIKKVMNDAQLATPETAFAWRAFFNDATTKNPLGLPYSSLSRPSTGLTTSDRGSAGGKKNTKKQTAQQQQQQQELTAGEQADAKGVELLKNREWMPDDLVAVVRLQKLWRGYYARKIKTARTPGTELNLKTQELLQKAYTAIEANTESHGLALFRSMFKTDPDLMQKYPFHLDEWNKISLADYQGSHPDQPPNSWFIVFREIFHVSEEMLCVPKLYVSIQTCMMRVIDNDTREELPRVFTKVAPHVYKKNKNGYTFVAEARTLDQPLPAGRWRMRLIGSLSPLPAPIKNEVNASFHSRELRDYYIPNEKNIVLRFARITQRSTHKIIAAPRFVRYVVKVTEDHLVSLQLQTSKSDVYIRLQVLDGDTELVQAVGKGHVVLPAILFQKDPGEDVPETKRSSSRQSNKGGRGAKEASRKRVNSAVEGRGSRSSSRSRHSVASMDEEDDKEQKPHKYVIQAVVMRSSWPLSEVQWAFVQTLKEIEKNELKVSHKQRDSSPPRSEKATAASKGKDKGGKGKGKEKGSRPPSQQFDMTKPHWLMRVVSDGNAAEEIEVKKDTERADEIRAMKKAWEAAEPGRAAKALQARLKYLNTHMVKVGGDDDDEEENADEHSEAPPTEPDSGSPEMQDAVLSLEPPCASPPKEELKKIDITPFLRKTCDTPRLRDEAEVQRQMEEKQKEIAAYRAFREQVEHKRELDRLNRNQQKIDQLQLYENMQVTVDSAREAINQRREAYREKFLAAERLRSEEIAALEAEQEKRTPTPKGKKSGKKSASGKRKK